MTPEPLTPESAMDTGLRRIGYSDIADRVLLDSIAEVRDLLWMYNHMKPKATRNITLLINARTKGVPNPILKEDDVSHECPECGQVCYCGGDLDDCEFSGTEEQMNCTHWKKCEREDGDELPPEIPAPKPVTRKCVEVTE